MYPNEGNINARLTARCRGERPDREISREGASNRVRARQLQTPVMGLGDPAGNGQAQSSAAAIILRPGTGFVGAEKALENAWLQICGDPSSGIHDAQSVFLPSATARHSDASALRGVLNRVIQQIEDHAAQE